VNPARIDVSGSFRLPAAPDVAFPLFTPRGEIRWVPGWEPRFLHPPTGELELDQVFATEAGGESTLWTVVGLDREGCAVDYLRVTPGSRLARVSVRVAGEGGGSRVHVRYLCTALNDEGAAALAEFERGFEAMLADWERLTSTLLTQGE